MFGGSQRSFISNFIKIHSIYLMYTNTQSDRTDLILGLSVMFGAQSKRISEKCILKVLQLLSYSKSKNKITFDTVSIIDWENLCYAIVYVGRDEISNNICIFLPALRGEGGPGSTMKFLEVVLYSLSTINFFLQNWKIYIFEILEHKP